MSCAGKSSTTSWTVAGSLVATAALSGGASAMTRAIVVNVWARVVRSSLTIAPVAVISRCRPFSASRITPALTRYTAAPTDRTASRALVRKMRLRSEEGNVFIER